MPGHHFISYSASDAESFAIKLADDLQAGPPPFPVWIFRRELHAAGDDWDAQLREAIRECDSLIFVMSRDSVTDESNCKLEWTAALKFKKPILLVRLHADAEAPFRIASRQFIDFAGDYKVGLAKLRKDLQWLHSPEGELRALKFRFADAERDLRRASDADRPRIQADLDLLRKQIAEQEKIVADPAAAAKRTEQSIERAIERERAPEKPISGKTRTKFINQPPGIAPSYYQDRFEENKIIGKFLRDESCRMMTVVGRAGIGKTAMVCRLLKSLESGRLPDDPSTGSGQALGELPVDGIVYLSAVGTRIVNVPNLFADLCQLLTDEKSRELDALYKNPQVTTEAKINALLAAFPTGRFIVLLDNFENVLDAETMNIRDAELNDALRALLNAPHHAVKVILTTRIAPHDLGFVQPGRQNRLNLDNGLEPQYAKNVLTENDADGTLGLKNATDDLLTRACEFTRGFPRALEALIAILRADRYTSLAEILGDGVGAHSRAPLPAPQQENIVEALVGEAFNRLDPKAQRVMQALAVYNRPVTPAAVDYLLQPFAASVDSAPVLNRLVTMQFVRRESGRYYLHPTDRAYAFAKIPNPKIPNPNSDWTQHDLTTRAADYFAQTRKPRETWKTLADLEPQLNEFDLRCAAEDYDTAASVLLEIDGDYLLLWGHYRLMIELHERLQGKIGDQTLAMLSVARQGLGYGTIGLIQKFIACEEKALAIARDKKDRHNEGAWLGNLGNAYSNLGDTRRAITFYEQALAIAREIGDKRGEGATLGSLGTAYSALGETRRAISFYEQALAIAREIGDKRGEGNHLGNLGLAYSDLGETRRAITFYEQALAIAREIGDKRGEGHHINELGFAYDALGQTKRAIEYYQQALIITREIGNKNGEGILLSQMGSAFVNLGQLERAVESFQQAVVIAQETGYRYGEGARILALAGVLIEQKQFTEAIPQIQVSIKIGEELSRPDLCNSAYSELALAHLYSGNLPAARAAAEAARKYDVPQNNHNVAALLGVIALRQNDIAAAQEAFTAAIQHADKILSLTPEYYAALDAKGVALCGLYLTNVETNKRMMEDAIATFRAARKINKDAGIVARVVRLLDALALANPNGKEILAEPRQAASGE